MFLRKVGSGGVTEQPIKELHCRCDQQFVNHTMSDRRADAINIHFYMTMLMWRVSNRACQRKYE